MATLAKLGDVTFNVISIENIEYNNEITDKSLEDGSSLTDHVKTTPIPLKITGMVTGPNSSIVEKTLISYRDNATLLRYVGKNLLENVLIRSFAKTNDNTIGNGFKFSLTLKQVKITQLETVVIDTRKIAPKKVNTVNPIVEVLKKSTVGQIGMAGAKVVGLVAEAQQEVAENVFNVVKSAANAYVNFKKKIFGGD